MIYSHISNTLVKFLVTNQSLSHISRRVKSELSSFRSDQQLSGRFPHLPLRTVCRFVECKLVVSRSSATRHRATLQRPRDQYHQAFVCTVPTGISSRDGKIDRPIYPLDVYRPLAKIVSVIGDFQSCVDVIIVTWPRRWIYKQSHCRSQT